MVLNVAQCENIIARLAERQAEYDLAIDMILAGRAVPMNDPLRHSLHRVASEAHAALEDGATLTVGELALLCAAEAIKSFGEGPAKLRNNHARTLFELSKMTFF